MGSYIHNKQFKYSDKKMFAIGCIVFIIGIAGHFTKIYLKGLGGIALAPIDFFDIFVILETIGLFTAFKYASVKWIKKDAKMIRERKIGEVILLFSSCSFDNQKLFSSNSKNQRLPLVTCQFSNHYWIKLVTHIYNEQNSSSRDWKRKKINSFSFFKNS